MGFILTRVLQGLATILVLLTVVFFLSRATGDPVALMVMPETGQTEIERIRRELGLDQPVYIQYVQYLANAARGDFGRSVRSRRPAMELVAGRILNSFYLQGIAFVFAGLIGIPLAIAAAVRKGTSIDHGVRFVASMGLTLPNFLVGILLIDLFSVRLGLLPSAGMGEFRHIVLPGFTMGIYTMAAIVRLLRSNMLDTLGADFIVFARIKGVPERWVIWKHALRNSLLASFTYAANTVAQIVTAAVVVETVFAWPGLGRLTFDAVMVRDFPVTQAAILTAAVIVIAMNLLTDVAYAYLDPRIRAH